MSVAQIRVAQQDGEIRIAVGGADPAVYPVNAGKVSVDDADVKRFMTYVDDAELVDGTYTSDDVVTDDE